MFTVRSYEQALQYRLPDTPSNTVTIHHPEGNMLLQQPISFHLRASPRRHSYHLLIIIVLLSIFIIFIIIFFFIMMFRVLIHLAALPLWVTGQLFSSIVHQRPVALTEGPGGDVQLTCSHTIPNYYVILWYKQSAGDTAMKLIGYAYTKSITMENSFEKHFNVSGDGGKEAYLHLVSLRGPEHSAVYYCAASQHSDVDFLLFSTKTQSDGNIRPRLRTPASEV
ncbi:uncharacterized protein LOC118944159 [Oncorhynchus mykiss]|uniref:uncharacterized protein LOC118944159 n=1 Tax=Oncorhynchus mykiss TaxID=8022 RepID=UPI0018778F75|nr:uncharacterized protein LOC118944159 [Oncorhynchus mykiss]